VHRTTKKLMIVAAVVIAMAAYFFLDLGRFLSLNYLQQQLDIIHSFYAENRLFGWLIFLAVYVVVTALSIPGAAVMTLAGLIIFFRPFPRWKRRIDSYAAVRPSVGIARSSRGLGELRVSA